MKNKIQYTDLHILGKVFFPKAEVLIIFDPSHRLQATVEFKKELYFSDRHNLALAIERLKSAFVLVNLSSHSIDHYNHYRLLRGQIDFSDNKEGTSFYYINNPNKSMRWVFPSKSKRPNFLYLYNGAGWKSSFYKKVCSLLYPLRLSRVLASGRFSIFAKDQSNAGEHFLKNAQEDFAVFTGTVGENRKSIIALAEGRKCSRFIKIPLTQSAKKLVSNEYQQLKYLNRTAFHRLQIPVVEKDTLGISLSNVQPESFETNIQWQGLHSQALEEMYASNAQKKSLHTSSIWKTINKGFAYFELMSTPQNGLSETKLKLLISSLQKVYQTIHPETKLNLATGHLDFTPWNMYLQKDTLHLYDWEMSAQDVPMLFDCFHYQFQKGILIERKPFHAIKKDIEDAIQLAETQRIIKKYHVDWKQHFSTYLLYITCYYLPKYIKQSHLHQQVHWLIDTWTEAIKEEISTVHSEEVTT